MLEDDIVMPYFEAWAKRCINSKLIYRKSCQEMIVIALKECFEQGRALGERSAEQQWWKEQDDSLKECTNEADQRLFETASLEDYMKYEEDCSNIIKEDIPVHEKLFKLQRTIKPWKSKDNNDKNREN